MSSLQAFLTEHPEMIVDNLFSGDTSQDTSDIKLNGILISANKNHDIIFWHMGYRFYISSSDIISIEELKDVTNTFEEGIAVAITVKTDTKIIPHEVVSAFNFNSGVPFAIARPSQIPEIDYPSLKARDLAWLDKNRIPCDAKSSGIMQLTKCKRTPLGVVCEHG
ncbi:MAG: hypothetical protein IPL59_02240 [Candidatus Competibacteraceae bacterium]|nr:hypothetical protein [Candidatus Competibacteraceae bacterium]